MSIHEQIVQAFNNYVAEQESFETKGVKAAAARARKALGDLGKLTKERRKEIQEKKNNMWLKMAMKGGQTFKDEKPNKKYQPYKSAFLNSIYDTGEIGRALSQKYRKGIASLNDRQKKIVDLIDMEMNKSKGGTVRIF